MLKTAKAVWRTVVPEAIRSSRAMMSFKSAVLPHNWTYDKDYFQIEVDRAALQSAPGMVDGLVEIYAPQKLVDVGCGTGALAAEFQSRGIRVFGLEYADAAIEMARGRKIDVRKFDIETSGSAPAELKGADLVVSFEVAEHLPEKIADKYVALLTSMGDHVVLSAAPPGQGGTDHVNEQPRAYWIEKFRANGFDLDEEKTARISASFAKGGKVAIFYIGNTLAFTRGVKH